MTQQYLSTLTKQGLMTHLDQQSNKGQTKIEELESIRGLAILLVVFYHMRYTYTKLDIAIINNGYLMVELFFVLSGFVIYNAYSEKIRCTKDLYRFQFLRFARLYPVHLVFLGAFLIIEIAKYFAATKLIALNVASTPFGQNSLWALIQQIFLIQAVIPNDVFTFNHPAWAISALFYTYLIFGLLMLFFKRLSVHFFGIMILASLLMLTTHTTLGFDQLLRCIAGFFLGCLTAIVIKTVKIRLSNYLSITVFISMILFLQLKTPAIPNVIIYFLSAALIFSIMLARNGILNKLLNIKMFTWLGMISYSIYMSHFFILWAVANVFKRILRPSITNRQYVFELTSIETIVVCVIVVISVLAVSYITYAFIEKPFRKKLATKCGVLH